MTWPFNTAIVVCRFMIKEVNVWPIVQVCEWKDIPLLTGVLFLSIKENKVRVICSVPVYCVPVYFYYRIFRHFALTTECTPVDKNGCFLFEMTRYSTAPDNSHTLCIFSILFMVILSLTG